MVEDISQRFVLKDLKLRWFSAVCNMFPNEKENFDLSQFGPQSWTAQELILANSFFKTFHYKKYFMK